MAHEEKLDEFVKRAREAAGPNLESIVLYGSAAAGDYHEGFSNLNVLCVVRDASVAALNALAPVAKWWDKQKQPAPMVMTREDLQRSTDVFAIELLDIRRHHRILHGEDVVAAIEIPMMLHRVQVEYELREKLLLLRQHLMLASDDEKRTRELLTRSVTSFVTLFRHALVALTGDTAVHKRDTLARLATHTGADLSVMQQLLDVRERKLNARDLNVQDVAAKYVAAIERVTALVDAAPVCEPPPPSR